MFRNNLKLAVRALLKSKTYSLINILGLAIGIGICLLIILFIQSELGYDNFHERKDRIYRLVCDRIYPSRVAAYTMMPNSIGSAFQHEFPEIQECTRIIEAEGAPIKVNSQTFDETGIFLADSNFFRVFTGRFLWGDAMALQPPGTIVINETTARRWYGSPANALGRSIEYRGQHFRINAVIQDWPGKSHLRFNILFSDIGMGEAYEKSFTGFSAYTYLLLSPNASSQALEAKFPVALEKYIPGEIEHAFGMSYQQFRASGNGYHYFLQPLTGIHLTSNRENELAANGSEKELWLFGLIALFILAIAAINFVNLSTARSMERAREVGIRKTFGSRRADLIRQFLLESVLTSLLSMVVAVGLVFFLLPFFDEISGNALSAAFFLHPTGILCLLAFAIGLGLTAGLYPSFVLSAFRPVVVLKGRWQSNRHGAALRNGLVIFQFALSIILIISTIIVRRQMRYMLGDSLGFKMDHVLVVENAFPLGPHTKAFKNELSRLPGVEIVSSCLYLPGDDFMSSPFRVVGSEGSQVQRATMVDAQFASLLGLQLKEGRFFSTNFSTDSLSVVLNETAVKTMQLTHPLGARINPIDNGLLNGSRGSHLSTFTVVGVLRDFHFRTLREKITPLLLFDQPQDAGGALVGIRVKGESLDAVMVTAQRLWKQMVPDRPFRYTFLDQHLADKYRSEQTTQKVFTDFSILAILIACIGLMGLAAYSTGQRAREIGIRKVLGAGTGNIFILLSQDFLRLVIVASFIALPVAWLSMRSWLQDFAYRVDLSWWVFLAGGVMALAIALFTISYQAVKAAFANPIDTLRSE